MSTSTTVRELAIEQVHPASDNLRSNLGSIAELQKSIETTGIHEPLLVVGHPSQTSGEYMIVAGHRRYEAAKRAGLTTVPCVVKDLSEQQRVEIMLIENLQREDISPVDEARGYFRLVESGMTVKDLASRIGRSQKHVSGRLRLLDLPAKVLKLVPEQVSLEAAEDVRALVTDTTFIEHDEAADGALVQELIENLELRGSRWAISTAQRAIEQRVRDAKVAEIRAKIEGRGGTLVEQEQKGYSGYGWPAGMDTLEALQIDPKDHRDEPCHAFGLIRGTRNAYGVDVTEVCTKKSRHTSKNATSDVKPDNYDELLAQRALQKAERDHEKAREQALLDAMRDGVSEAKQAELMELVVYHLAEVGLDQANVAKLAKMAEVVGCVPEVEDGKPSHHDYLSALLEHAGASKAGAVRVAATVALLGARSWGNDDLAVQAKREAIWQPHHTEPSEPAIVAEARAKREADLAKLRQRREEERAARAAEREAAAAAAEAEQAEGADG